MRPLLFFFAIFVSPAIAEEFSRETISEALKHVQEMVNFNLEGKSVKAEQEKDKAVKILRKTLIKGKRYSLPENCKLLKDRIYSVDGFDCDELSGIRFEMVEPDKRIREAFEDCDKPCTGEFILMTTQYGSGEASLRAHYKKIKASNDKYARSFLDTFALDDFSQTEDSCLTIRIKLVKIKPAAIAPNAGDNNAATEKDY
jgi:hypothetical protein